MSEHILVVDDEPDVRMLIELALSGAGFETVSAADGAEALQLAIREHPRLVVLDVMMPEMDGLEVCARLRADGRTSDIPVIMLTARAQGADTIAGLEAGADDYVTKPFAPEELVARVHAALRRASQMRAVSPLTGLPGNARVERELSRRLADGEPFALLYADLNHFKGFNDRYGFLRGDEMIRTLARVLEEAAGEVDIDTFLGHVGGDDFVILTQADAAEQIAQRVCRGFDRAVPALYDPDDLDRGYIEVTDRRGRAVRYEPVSVSIGIVAADGRRYAHPSEVVSTATEMKRFAKQRCQGPSNWETDRRRSGAPEPPAP